MPIDEYLASKSETGVVTLKLSEMIKSADEEGMESKSWQDVVKYMDDHNVQVHGQKASDYIWGVEEVGKASGKKINREHMEEILKSLRKVDVPLDKGQLMTVKSALDTRSSECRDKLSQFQLELQRIVGDMGRANDQTSNLMKKLDDMLKTPVRNIG
jgi:exonuclease VII small subunit